MEEAVFESDQRRLTLLVIKCVCLSGASYNKDAQVSSHFSHIVMLTINSLSPWEMISGFNLTVTRRGKRQGMKLCSGIRTICDSTSLPADVRWGSVVTHSFLPHVGEKWVRDNRTPTDVCGEAMTPLDLTSLTRGNARGNSIRRPPAFICNFCYSRREWLSCSW